MPSLEELPGRSALFPVPVPEGRLSANPARRAIIDLDAHYYAIGNTFGADVLGEEGGDAHVLLLACGDVRNAVETVAAWWGREHGGSQRLALTLNDASAAVLVRDTVLLDLMYRECDADGDGGISYNEFVDKLARETVAPAAMGKRGMQSLEAMGVDAQEMIAMQLGHGKKEKFNPSINQ